MLRSRSPSRLVTLAAGVVLIAGLHYGRELLIPLALAVVVSFLLGPLVLRLQRWMPRALAVVLTILLVFAATGGIGWLVAGQFQQLAAALPEYRHSIRERVASVREVLESSQTSQTVQDLGAEIQQAAQPQPPRAEIETVRIAEPEKGALETLRGLLSPTLDILITAGLALVFAFIMLLRRGDLRDRFIRLAGEGRILVTTQALDEAAQGISSYLMRLVLLNGVHGLMIALGLFAIGVPNALLFGTLAGLLRFIPYLGPWIAASFPVLTSMATSTGWSQPVLVMSVIAVLELLSNLVLEPWVYGRGTGLSPLALLVSTLFWTWLWGPVGIVLATPFTVCLVLMGKHLPPLRLLHMLFSNTPGLPAPARLYQRLLAGEPDLAWEVIEDDLKSKPLVAVYDEVVLPALSLAETDRARGVLDDEPRVRVEDGLALLIDEAEGAFVASSPAAAATVRDPAAALSSAGAASGGASSAAPSGAMPLPGSASPAVLCLAARDSADVLAATMLAQVLRREGLSVEVAPLAALSGELLAVLESRPIDAVCISAVPPSRFLHVRYLCKRIAARHPALPIVVGLWGQPLDGPGVAEHIPRFDTVQAVSSLADAAPLVRRLALTRRTHREAGLASASPASAAASVPPDAAR